MYSDKKLSFSLFLPLIRFLEFEICHLILLNILATYVNKDQWTMKNKTSLLPTIFHLLKMYFMWRQQSKFQADKLFKSFSPRLTIQSFFDLGKMEKLMTPIISYWENVFEVTTNKYVSTWMGDIYYVSYKPNTERLLCLA